MSAAPRRWRVRFPSASAIRHLRKRCDIENGDLTTAPLLPGRLRSADAIHLATALRLHARAMVVYDTELHAASRTAGIDALGPGAN